MPTDDTRLTDAEIHELTKNTRRWYPSKDPIHDGPPAEKPAEDMTPQDHLDLLNWRNRR